MEVKYIGTTEGEKNGYIGEHYKVGDRDVYIYIPQQEVGDVVNATVYYPGNGKYTFATEGEALSNLYLQGFGLENGGSVDPSRIFISFSTGDYGRNDREIINSLIDYFSNSGINVNVDTLSANSYGGGAAPNTFLEVLTDKYSESEVADPMSLILYDPYGSSCGNEYTFEPKITDEQIKLMEDNKCRVVFFTTEKDDSSRGRLIGEDKRKINECPLRSTNNFFDKIASSGDITPIIISSTIAHAFMTKRPTLDGWQLYFDGLIGLEDINNNYSYVAERTGEKKYQSYNITIPIKDENGNIIWKTYSLSSLVEAKNNFINGRELDNETKLALFTVEYEAVKINWSYIERVDDIVKEIGRINNNELDKIGFSSTSNLLENENILIDLINNAKDSLANSFKDEANKIASAGVDYLMTEKKLDEKVAYIANLNYHENNNN